MRDKYDRKLFHWSYIFKLILVPVFFIIWVVAKIENGSNAKGFIESLKSMFNEHECEFSNDLIYEEGLPFRECKNKHCNMCTPLDNDGNWLNGWNIPNKTPHLIKGDK